MRCFFIWGDNVAELFRFFNSTQTDIRQYQAEDFAQFFGNFLGNGFFEGLSVSSENSMNTLVAPGSAFIEGHEYTNTTSKTLQHDPADPTYNRIDRVVLRLNRDIDERSIKAFVKKGIPSGSPAPPALTRNDVIYELSLAQVVIEAGKSFIDSTQIIGERGDNEVCGRVQVARKVGDQINTVDIKPVDAPPEDFSEGISQFYLSGSAQSDIMQGWLDSIGISPSDYGRSISSLRAYVHTVGNRTNTGVQTFTLFAWDYQSDYQIYGEWKRANNAINPDVKWGKWQENVLIVDEGENENGEYIRYSNGVQECWARPFGLAANESYGNIFMTDSSKWWEYPKPFAGGSPVFVSGDISAIGTWATITSATGGDGVYFRAMSYYRHEAEYTLYCYAKGRWR